MLGGERHPLMFRLRRLLMPPSLKRRRRYGRRLRLRLSFSFARPLAIRFIVAGVYRR